MTGADEPIACSVILPALRDSPGLQATLRALSSQASDRPYEVIVVSPELVDLSACPSARLVRDEGRGPAAALNAGIAAARGEVLAFTDADCVPDAGWLAAGTACMSGVDLVAGRIVQTPGDSSASTTVEEFEVRWSLRQHVDVRQGLASASNFFVHRDVFERIGTFREEMRTKSDWDLCERARDAGCTLAYCDAAVVRHRVIATWGGLWQSKLRLAGGMARLHRARGRGKSAARRDALRQLRPPLRSLMQVVRAEAPRGRKLALVGTLVVSRVAYLVGWVQSEVRDR